jgi:O-antigen ligase
MMIRTLAIALLATLSVSAAVILNNGLVAAVPMALLLFVVCFRHTRQAHLLLLFLIPLSMEVQLTAALGTDFPDEALMWMLSLPITVIIFRSRDESAHAVRQELLFRILLVQWLWACTTIWFSAYPLLSLKYVLAKAWYILPFAGGAALFLNNRQRIVTASVVMITTMAAISIGVMARQAMTGFEFAKVNDAVRPLFRNHVNYSALLVCLLPLSVAGAYLSRKYRVAFLALSLFWLIAVFLTYSRGAWLAVPVGIITALALRYRMLGRLAALTAVIIFAAITLLALNNRYLDHRPDFNRTIYHADLAGHIEATYRLRDLSTAERFHRWIAAFRMMEGHWMQGHGPNSFYPEYKPHVVNSFKTWVSANPERSTVHNYFLLLLTEQGLPGLILFIILLIAMFRKASRLYHDHDDPFLRTMTLTIAAILGMIITLIMLSDLIETDKIGGLFYTIVGVLSSGAGFNVQRITQPIAQQVEREHEHHDGQAG